MIESLRAPRRRRRVLISTATASSVLLALLGCTTNGASSERSAGDDSTGSATTAAHDWDLAFASCMRDAGLDYDDPAPDGSEAPITTQADSAAFERANETCTSRLTERLGERPISEDRQHLYEEWNAKNEKLADCLRKKGHQAEADDEGGFSSDDRIPDADFAACGGDDFHGVGGDGR